MFPAIMFVVAEKDGVPQFMDTQFYTSEIWVNKRKKKLEQLHPDLKFFIAYADTFKRL